MAKPEIRLKGFEGEWDRKYLADEVSFFSGLTYTPSNIRSMGTLVLRSSNVQEGEISLSDNVYVDPAIVYSPFVKKNDIIVVVRNGSRSLIGKHAQIKNELPNTVIGAFMTGIRSSHPEFMNALLSSRSFDKEVEKNLGATINQITNGTFRSMSFCFPHVKEQDDIGQYFKSLDSMIQGVKKKIASLKQMKQACLVSMFPQAGETTPRVRFKGFKGEWGSIPLSHFSKKVTRKNNNLEYKITLTNSAEFGVINQLDFFDHDISNGDNIRGYYVVENDDFVYNPRISATAPVGPINRNMLGYSGVMSPLYYVFKVNGIDKDYLNYFFKTKLWHKFMKDNGNSGARFDRLSITDDVFVQMPIFCPKDIAEQQQIASFFRSLDSQISLQEQRLEKLKQIKSACLDKMFV
jgi:type I restriction enzyme S subunit